MCGCRATPASAGPCRPPYRPRASLNRGAFVARFVACRWPIHCFAHAHDPLAPARPLRLHHLLTLPLPAAAEGKLGRARDEVRGGSSSSSNRDSSSSHRRSSSRHDDDDRDSDSDEDDDDDGGIIGALFGAIFDSLDEPDPPPYRSWSSGPSLLPSYGYARYPYADGHDGFLVSRELEIAYQGELRPLARRPHDYALQLTLEAGYLDGVARGGTNLRLLSPSRFEVGTRLAFFHEWLDQPERDEADTDTTSLGATHLSYRIGQGSAGLLRLGIGMRYLIDRTGADAGFDMLVGAELFVARPFVLSLELTGGTLGDAVVFAPRAQLGLMLGRTELFASYEHLVIGEVELPAPMLGTRIWF